jgi:hypothetical protein
MNAREVLYWMKPAFWMGLILIAIAVLLSVVEGPSTTLPVVRPEQNFSTGETLNRPSVEEMMPLFHPRLGHGTP